MFQKYPPEEANFGALCHVSTPPLEVLGGFGEAPNEVPDLQVPEFVHEALDGFIKFLQ